MRSLSQSNGGRAWPSPSEEPPKWHVWPDCEHVESMHCERWLWWVCTLPCHLRYLVNVSRARKWEQMFIESMHQEHIYTSTHAWSFARPVLVCCLRNLEFVWCFIAWRIVTCKNWLTFAKQDKLTFLLGFSPLTHFQAEPLTRLGLFISIPYVAAHVCGLWKLNKHKIHLVFVTLQVTKCMQMCTIGRAYLFIVDLLRCNTTHCCCPQHHCSCPWS